MNKLPITNTITIAHFFCFIYLVNYYFPYPFIPGGINGEKKTEWNSSLEAIKGYQERWQEDV